VTDSLTTLLLWFSALGCGLLGGLYFAFSAFIMTALGRLEPSQGIAAMNAINVTILRSWFMPFFVATTLSSLVAALLGLLRSDQPGAAMVTGGVIYVVGMFVVTMVRNVPLNNLLAAADPRSAEGSSAWARYLKEWTFWNHVRTLSCVIGSALFTWALAAN
jgi:uncharacterized membrane protein